MIGLGAYRRMGRFQCYIFTFFLHLTVLCARVSRETLNAKVTNQAMLCMIFTYACGVVVTYKALSCTNLRRDVPQKL